MEVDIQMRKDGSAKVTLEYRFSRMAETVGKLDGNEKWPVIPVGREDWQRTEQRVEGMKVASFSSSRDARDIVNKVTLEFKNTESFLKFLDQSGRRASLSGKDGFNKLHLTLNEKTSSKINSDLLELVRQVCEGYSFKINLSAPASAAINFTDGEGKEIAPPASVSSQGKKASLSIATAEIFSSAQGLGLDLVYK